MAISYKSSTIALSAAAAAVLTFTGCGSSGGGGGGGDVPPPATSCLAGSVLEGDCTENVHLTKAGSPYEIKGLVKIKNSASITIDPGVTLFGDEGANYMVVTKGSKIFAEGTSDEHIVFTSKTALNGGEADTGQWGGLTILGAAPTNHDDPRYEVDENDEDFAFGNAAAGAGNANDNSGVLTYVDILNSGYTVATDLEINGLSLAGVGAGTKVENIKVVNSSDDCVEIWGGTVNVSNLDLINCNDDSFDLDYGYVGHAKNITVTQVNAAHAGFEISSGGTNPMTGATITGFTINKVNGSDEGGIYIKDDTTAPIFVNGLVSTVGSDATVHTKKALTPAAKAQIAFNNVLLNQETFDGDGAADVQTRWNADDAAAVASDCLSGKVLEGDCTVTTVLSKDGGPYEIKGLVKVKDHAIMAIEAGTTLYGDEGANYMVVTKGSKIIAQGTASDKITFTSKIAHNGGMGDIAQWGGLTVLGAAPTNHADPHYEVDENDPEFAFGNAEAGMGDALNYSGIIAYVDVLNSGYTVATDLEINGLSLAGVGATTVVHDVVVTNSSDDCVEIWGGTVNVSNLELTNCNDDSFDLDYGYVGTATDITVTQVNAAHAGFEISSGGTNPMTGARINGFTIEKVDGSDEGGIYIKDDTTAPIFLNGSVTTLGASDAAIHTKKALTAAAKAQLAFKNVDLNPETFDGDGAADVQERWEANDAQ